MKYIPLLYDINHDGYNEMIIIYNNPHIIIEILDTNSLQYIYKKELNHEMGIILSNPLLIDINKNNQIDLVIYTSNAIIYTIEFQYNQSNQLITSEIISTIIIDNQYIPLESLESLESLEQDDEVEKKKKKIDGSIIIADILNNNQVEYIIYINHHNSSYVLCYNPSSLELIWSYYIDNDIITSKSLIVADIDDDQIIELIMGTKHGQIHLLNSNNGQLKYDILSLHNNKSAIISISITNLDSSYGISKLTTLDLIITTLYGQNILSIVSA